MTPSERIIGDYSQRQAGPNLLILGGIHGNEPAGVYALERVFHRLEALEPPFRGRFVGLKGNVPALTQQRRFIDRDLNRLWSESEIARIQQLAPKDRNAEEKQLIELLEIIESVLNGQGEADILIDLHTTSAPGGLFSLVNGPEPNRVLASSLHAPVIFGMTTELSSTTNVFIEDRGYHGIAFESGQHDDPASVDKHEAAIWLLLEKAGCVDPENIPEFEQYHRLLITASRALPHYMEVVHRHPIVEKDHFYMHPGFTNFHKVYKGEPIARDQAGDIICPESGMMLMPLYQPQGEDGFYVIRSIEEPPV
jgi:predicted deacylase